MIARYKTKINLKSSAHKNRNLSATLPGNDARKVLDSPQVQGIVVAPINVEVWGYRTAGALFSKLLIRRRHVGSLKENLLSAKQLQKPC